MAILPASTPTVTDAANPWSLFPGGKDPFSGLGSSIASEASSFFLALPWMRIGETILGLLLIAVGLSKLTDAVPSAAKLAKLVS